MGPYKKPAEILLIEDNPGDVELMREALKRGGYNAHLHVAPGGREALDHLLRCNGHSGMARPDIVLLDLSLPGKSGRQLLADIKNNPGLTDIPVIVLTGSEAEEHIREASVLHANCYVAKPGELAESMRALHGVLHFWLEVVRLPNLL